MLKKYYYETTYEVERTFGDVEGAFEIRFTFNVSWGAPARINFNEHDHPEEASEVEITAIEKEDWETVKLDNKPRIVRCWRPIQDEGIHDILIAWAEKEWIEDMLIEAQQTEAAWENEAEEKHEDERRSIDHEN